MAKKADAMGKEIDSLYLSLGLNVADLEMGFQTAGQTVRQAMSRLNSEAKQIQLKADIDVSRLEAAGKSVDALKAREKALNDELAVQQKKLELLNRAYEANAKEFGKNDALTRGVDTKRLYQERDIEKLKNELRAIEEKKLRIKLEADTEKVRAAETKIQAEIRSINAKIQNIRLRADIDVSSLEAAGKSVDALKAREKALNDELDLQNKKLQQLKAAYNMSVQKNGTQDVATINASGDIMRQQQAISTLRSRIAAVNAELAKTSTTSTNAFGKISAGASRAQGAVKELTSSISAVNAKIAGVTATVAGGYGLFSITDNAMKAGNDLYKLSSRLHTTTAEASKLSKVFKLSGVDIDSVIPLFARLDKQALAAEKGDNAMAQAMREFGFSLTDSGGNLLSYEKQLEQLAVAYGKAVKSGREAEFVTNVLGARGAALVPLLQDYATNLEIVSRVKTTGLLNPKEAHELYIEWQAMQMQAGQLTGAIGQALMPVAKDLMPEITQGFAEFAKLISENKDSIKEFGSAAGTAIGGLSSAIVSLISVIGDLKKELSDISGTAKDIELLKANGMEGYLSKGKTAGAIIGGMVGGSAFGPAGAVGGAALGANVGESIYGKVGALLTPEKELAAAKQRIALKAQEKKAFEEFNKQITESQKNAYSSGIQQEKDLAKAMKDAAKEAKAANEELEKSIYSLTHSDLQNSLHGVDMAAKASLEKGADPEKVALEAQLKKGKILEAQEREVAQYLDSVYADSLTQRLNQIEREKKAWIQKGLDEVRATQAAEQQKRNAVNDSVKSMFTSQKKYLEIYRDAMAGRVGGNGVYMYDYKLSQEQRQQNAIKAMREAMMKDAGVKPWESTSMEEVLGFQRAMKGADSWGLSLLQGGVSGGGGVNMGEVSSAITESNAQISSLLGQISGDGIASVNANLEHILDAINQQATPVQVNVSPSINVDLGGAYVFDDKMKKTLTDDITSKVAAGVSQAARNALANVNYGYGG